MVIGWSYASLPLRSELLPWKRVFVRGISSQLLLAPTPELRGCRRLKKIDSATRHATHHTIEPDARRQFDLHSLARGPTSMDPACPPDVTPVTAQHGASMATHARTRRRRDVRMCARMRHRDVYEEK